METRQGPAALKDIKEGDLVLTLFSRPGPIPDIVTVTKILAIRTIETKDLKKPLYCFLVEDTSRHLIGEAHHTDRVFESLDYSYPFLTCNAWVAVKPLFGGMERQKAFAHFAFDLIVE